MSHHPFIVDQEQLPCDKSSVEDCPPPKTEEIGAEAGGSLFWLFCFIFAAIGGAVLIFLNKKKTEVLETTEDEKGMSSESLLDTPVKPPRTVTDSQQSAVSSLVV